MRPIPERLKKQMANDSFYAACSRKFIFRDHWCKGRITWEHAFIYAGKQINEVWAIIPLCAYAHFIDCDKRKNEYIALMRATDEDLAKYPKRDWKQLRRGLMHRFR